MKNETPILVENYMGYVQCKTLREIKRAIKNKTYYKDFEGRSWRKTFRERLSELFRKQPYYKGRNK